MSNTTIDSKVVEMRFDNKQFEQGISQSINSLDKLKSTLKFDGVIDDSKLSSIAKGVEYLSSRFTALGQVLMGVKMQAINLVKSLSIDQIGEGWVKYNQIIASTQTIMSATAKNWTEDKSLLSDQGAQMEYVTEQLDKLNRFTDETSAKLTDMTSNIGKFTSAGVKLDVATDAMMGIATWGYKSGASIDQMSRAMYNLSQAMGMGALRVQDWMSIENANMATEEFKDTCIKTGLELGVLKQKSNGAIYALDRYGKAVEVTTENFRSTLAAGWLNSDVITATLKKYGDFASEILQITDDIGAQVTPMMRDIQAVKEGTLDLSDASAVANRAYKAGTKDVVAYTEALQKLSSAEYDLGFTAFRASQEAKTFQEAIDYTKDAVSTGWMNTFKTIVGNYLEAKELWTAVTEEMYDVFIFDLERQNEILKEWGNGGGREALLEGISNAWTNIKTLIETIKDTFRKIFPPATADTLLNITNKFKAFTYVLELTESQTDRIKGLFETFFRGIRYITQGVQNFWDVMVESIKENKLLPKDFFAEGGLYEKLKELIQEFTNFSIIFRLTKENAQKFKPVFDSVFQLFSAAVSSVKNLAIAFSTALRKVFGDSQLGLLDSVAKLINNITKAFEVNDERAKKFQTIFEAIFALIDIGKTIIEAILKPIFGLSDGVTDLSDIILNVTEVIAKWILALRDFLKEHDGWKKAIETVIGFLRNIPIYANKASQALFGMDLGELFDNIREAAGNAAEFLKGVFNTIIEDIKAIFNPLKELKDNTEDTGETSKSVFGSISERIDELKSGWEKVKPVIEEVLKMFKENVDFEWPSMEEVGDAAVKGGIVTVLLMLAKGLKNFFDLFKKAGKIEDSIKGVFTTLSSSIKTLTGALKDRIKADTFKVLATGILEIAAAMFVLALLPEEKLMASTFAVGAMVAELAFAFGLISRTNTSKDKLKQIKGALSVLEVILATLITGVFVIATKTDIDSAIVAASMIATLLAEVGLFMKLMESTNFTKAQAEKLEKMFLTLSVLMTAMGASLMMASSGGDWASIAAAGTVMSAMLFAMAGALQVMPKSEEVKALSGALTLLSVAMLLIGSAIAIAASSGDWTSIAAAGATMAGMLIAMAGALKLLSGQEDILKAAAALTVLSVGMLMLGSAISLLGNLNLEQAAMGVLTMSAALVVLLAAGAVAEKVSIGLLALGGAIALIGVGVLAAGAGVSMFADGIERLVGLGTTGTDTFIDAVTKFFENLPMYASNAGDALINFIKKIAGAKETLISGIETVLTSLLQALINVTPKILELAVTLITGILNSLVETMPALMTFLRELFTNVITLIWEQTPIIVDTIIMLTKELLRSLREIVPDITETLMFILKDTLTQIRDNIEEIISLSVEIGILTITGFLKGLIEQIPNIVSTGIEFVLALINGIADGIEEHAEDMRETMFNLVMSLVNAFKTLLGINSPSTVFEGFGDNIVQGLINGIGSMIDSAKKKITELADKVLTAICDFFGIDKPKNKDELLQLGIKLIQKFNQGIQDMISKAKEAITSLADKVLTAICDFFGVDKPKDKQEFYKLGLNIINAFKNAISSLTNKVKDAVAGVANSAVDKFKSVLGIHSPSTVFTEFGKFIDLGLANGLDKYSYLASDASDSVGQSIIDQMGAVMAGVASMLDDEFEDPTIKPVLDLTDVTNGMNTLDNMLSADRSMSLANYASGEFNERMNSQSAQSATSSILGELKNLLNGKIQNGVTNNNVFNITGDDPKEIAEEVSRILQNDVERREAVWGS